MSITKYGDVGTPQRHVKFGGVIETNVDGQLRGKGVENYIDAFLEAKIFNQEQFNSAYQLCRDYIIGVARRSNTTMNYNDSHGSATKSLYDMQEEARQCFNHAIRWNPSFLAISALADINIDSDAEDKIKKYKTSSEKYQRICDRLTYYYCNFKRDEIISKLRAR